MTKKLTFREEYLLTLMELDEKQLVPSVYYEDATDFEGKIERPCKVLGSDKTRLITKDESGHKIAYERGGEHKLSCMIADTGYGLIMAEETKYGQGNYWTIDKENKTKTLVVSNVTKNKYKRGNLAVATSEAVCLG